MILELTTLRDYDLAPELERIAYLESRYPEMGKRQRDLLNQFIQDGGRSEKVIEMYEALPYDEEGQFHEQECVGLWFEECCPYHGTTTIKVKDPAG